MSRMFGLPKKHCRECQGSAGFTHCFYNSPYSSRDEFCKNECKSSPRMIELFGKRDCNRTRKKLGLKPL